MAAVIELIHEETGRPKAEFELSRFLDESVLDELERKAFSKSWRWSIPKNKHPVVLNH